MDALHFFSDGPTAQYRNRGNFYLLCKILAQKGIKFGTWNVFEAGHGKGAPDGVGATVKRLADSQVSTGSRLCRCKFYVQNSSKHKF